jgi:hypothetical protein
MKKSNLHEDRKTPFSANQTISAMFQNIANKKMKKEEVMTNDSAVCVNMKGKNRIIENI